MLVDMKQMVNDAANAHYAVPAFNVFGYEDAKAVVEAAEEVGAPVILATNIAALKHMPLPYLAPVLTRLAKDAAVPVVVHLDHGKDIHAVKEAIAHGYSSVMFDGSQLPLEDNIARTKEIAELAKASGVSMEAEIGSVGYSDPAMQMKHILTDPDEAARFAEETGIDAVAVSIGTVHRMTDRSAQLDFDLLQRIQDKTRTPLVIHGSSGVPDDQLRRLVTYRVGKINIGTALRMAFGQTLRREMMNRPDEFDRIALFKPAMEAVKAAAIDKFRVLGFA